ncbi:hypothetical protein [Flavobacterium sp. 14A]|uniref:hypothetical protein n=1 Tax=Flavobacterium sp. 14A TaxID=2735896 RepID=UPI00156FBBD9|nr:hypothetical protein [Flavobacterium sp. 14A]NRT12389.1 hypothetical protein [Flavobacterium sp. 14A]
MKLTNQQIDTINEILVLNGLVYDDIKLELVDHIASEIELAMDDKEVLFEEALKTAFSNWRGQLQPSTSIWLGSKNSAPRIVIDKWESIHRKENRSIFKYSFISFIVFFGIIKLSNDASLTENLTGFLSLLYLSLWVSIVALRGILGRNKNDTIFSSIFKKRSRMPLVGLILIALSWIPNKTLGINSILEISSLYCIFLLLSFTVSTLKLAYKHFQFEKKVSKALICN